MKMTSLLDRVGRIRRVRGEAELAAYAEGYRRASGHRVPLEPLRRGEVWAACDGRGGMIGGFVLGWAPPYRTLEAIPPEARAALGPGPLPRRTVEICCLWIDRPHRRRPIATALYLVLAARVLTRRPSSLLYGTTLRRFKAFFELTGWDHPLYAGPVVIDGVRRPEGWIYACPLGRFARWLPVALRYRRRRHAGPPWYHRSPLEGGRTDGQQDRTGGGDSGAGGAALRRVR